MRRLLTGLTAYAAGLIRASAHAWDRFFFTPADPTTLGVLRVLVGAMLTWSVFAYGLDLQGYLGSTGWADPTVVRQFQMEQRPGSWSFWFYVPDSMLRPVWLGCVAILLAFTLGILSRVTAVLAWIIVVATSRRVPIALYGFDQIIATWALYVACTGASGQAVSLDRYFARLRRNRAEVAKRNKDGRWTAPGGRPEPTVSANVAIRLLQCHLAVVYLMSGMAKLLSPRWWEGNALWRTLVIGDFRVIDLTWMAAYPDLINILTHVALTLEIVYIALVWVGPLRPLIVGSAILMHVGIGMTLGLWEFGLTMIVGNVAFFSGPWLRSLVTGLEPQPLGKVLYDGFCPRCRASMALITAGDPDRLIEPVDLNAVDVSAVHPSLTKEACLRSMHLVERDGKVQSGYDAVMTILAWTPLFSAFSLLRFIPGVSPVGRRVYNRIAASRPRDQVCNDEVCGLHPPVGREAVGAGPPSNSAAPSKRSRR